MNSPKLGLSLPQQWKFTIASRTLARFSPTIDIPHSLPIGKPRRLVHSNRHTTPSDKTAATRYRCVVDAIDGHCPVVSLAILRWGRA